MVANGLVDRVGTPVVKVGADRCETPERLRAKLTSTCKTHGDAIRKLFAHVVQEQVRVQRNETAGTFECADVAADTTDLIKKLLANLCLVVARVGLRSCKEHGELDDVEKIFFGQLRIGNAIGVDGGFGRRGDLCEGDALNIAAKRLYVRRNHGRTRNKKRCFFSLQTSRRYLQGDLLFAAARFDLGRNASG